jgi:hypothetical protein
MPPRRRFCQSLDFAWTQEPAGAHQLEYNPQHSIYHQRDEQRHVRFPNAVRIYVHAEFFQTVKMCQARINAADVAGLAEAGAGVNDPGYISVVGRSLLASRVIPGSSRTPRPTLDYEN